MNASASISDPSVQPALSRSARLSHWLWHHKEILLLTVLGFGLRLYMARLDPFLHEWDERFHALVARNLMHHPWKPMLNARPLVAYDPNVWCCNSIWLHKQPLFLWQIAVSLKLFGVSEYAVRYPSVLLGTLMIPMLYRLARLLTADKTTALIAAALLCCSNYQLELISGRIGMDHNDVSFCFYILASIWAYAEYLRSPKWYWVVAVGVFSGGAILNKWLTGLLVYAAWGLRAVVAGVRGSWWPFRGLLLSLLVCCVVFLPWQLFILARYHDLALYEYAFNAKHISEAVEGHSGTSSFYIDRLGEYLGPVIGWLVPLGIGWSLLRRRDYRQDLNRSFLLYIAIVFLFFSLVVQSKMPSFVFIVSPLLLLYTAVALKRLFEKSPAGLLLVVLVSCYGALNWNDIQAYRQDSPQRAAKIHNTEAYKKLRSYLPPGTDLVININSGEHVDAMFYNDGLSANHWWITEDDATRLQAGGYRVAAFEERSAYILPDYVKKMKGLYIIPVPLEVY